VTPISTATNRAGTPINLNVGCNPLVLAVGPDDKTVYVVSNSLVAAVGTATGRAAKPIDVGKPPAIAIVPPPR
jgi:DNA-binding beta-propeller fold protein YncE